VEDGRAYFRSDAPLHVARRLRFPWPLLFALVIVPRPLRDRVYDVIAARRYRWFGRQDVCMLPTPQLRGRFLDDSA
jgi:predicted DCC family thiol-disulfide oxidoreductase YuxK